MKFLERYQTPLHLMGWLVFISLPLLTIPGFLRNPQDLLSLGMAQLLTSLLIMVYFYINLGRLTPALLQGGSPRRFWLIMGLMLVSVLAIKVGSFYAFPPAQPPRMPPPPMPPGMRPTIRLFGPRSPWPSLPGTAISFGFAMVVASMIALFRYHTRALEAQQQMALEKVSAELAMLKLQVSPHFLFNTLNNIRWLARQKSDQTENAIITLAQLLRYMIYQARHDWVPLRQEVEHVQHYIDLQKMRLTARHTVRFTVSGDVDKHQIEPLLFIPFVENAFKYGTNQAGGGIDIWLRVDAQTLEFGAENPMPITVAESGSVNAESGIGIANVRQRLALHYPETHTLQITETDLLFRVVLTLQLHHA
ncbi:sensor histidine kinase [Rudanella lutea]|uniref:sensor histidine kinase n=1 Tax=Rudanella lutea TaxID=451374 RepID=UPI00037517FA|nr:histidine kinase [Rudanella lutea]